MLFKSETERYDFAERIVNTKIADMTEQEMEEYIFHDMMNRALNYDDDALELAGKWVGVEHEA